VDIEIKNTTEILQDYLNYIQDEVKIKKTPLGFEKIDKLLNGGLPNGLITLGAIPSLGKTTFMLQVADNMASLENTKVLFFSLEMSRYNLISKSLSRLTYLNENLQDLTYDELECNNENVDFNSILADYEPIANNLYTIDYIYDIRDIVAFITQFRECNTNSNVVVIIDYLQYILSGGGNDKQAIDLITKRLKELSKSLGITIVAISSLNRANYDGTITMESFKESGSIEYTSDILMGLEYTNKITSNNRDYEAKKNPRKVSLNIIKNRYGALGKVNLEFNMKYSTFIEK
jgi:replicative DNA helicase